MPQKLSLYDSEASTSPKLSLYGPKAEETDNSLFGRFRNWWNEDSDWFKKLKASKTIQDAESADAKLRTNPDKFKQGLMFAAMGDQAPLSPLTSTEFAGQFVGSPSALAGTAASVAGFGAASKLGPLAKIGKAGKVADRAVSGTTAITQVPAFTEAVRKGEVGKSVGTGLGVALGTLGARAPNTHPDVSRFPAEKLDSFTITNPSPRNLAAAKERGFLEGPVIPGKGSSKPRGQILIGDDRVPELPAGTEGPKLYPSIEENAVKAQRVPYTKEKLKAVKRPVKDAEGKIVLGENGKPTYKTVKEMVPDEPFAPVFQRWANGRRAADYESALVKQEFKDLDKIPVSQLASDPAAMKTVAEKVKPYFDKKYGQLIGAGKQLGYREDYIPQMWANPKEEVDAVFGSGASRLALKKGFEFKRVLENYQEGISKGLTPKFENISDLTAFYEKHANKAIEDINFFNYLKASGQISTKQIKGKVPLPESLFPVKRGKTGDVSPWYATPEVADAITGFLEGKEVKGLEKLGQNMKTIALAAGVPKTAVNFHGISVIARDVMSTPETGSKLGTLVKDVKMAFNPEAGKKYIADNLAKSADAVRDGLQLSTEHIPFRIGEGGKDGFLGWSQRTFEDPLFQGLMPAMKLEKYDLIKADLIAKGINQVEAGQLAAKQTNEIFGGIDFKTMIADNRFDKNMKFLLDKHSSWFLAPQWLASQGYLAKDVATALKNPADPRGRAYQAIAKNLAVTYTQMNVTNKILSGHWMGENDNGHFFDIDTGQTDSKGKKIYVSPLGTGADFVRLPVEAAFKIGEGDFKGLGSMAAGRLGPIPSLATQGLTGRTWYGKPLNSAKDYAGLMTDYLPPYARAGINLMQDDQSKLQSLAQSVELPIRFRRPEKKKLPKF